MSQININGAFETLQKFYACGKCKTTNITTPVLLKTCRHIFCTRCLVIRGTQSCPKCQQNYTPGDVDRGNPLLTAIFGKIKFLENPFPNGDYTIEHVPVASTSRHNAKAVQEQCITIPETQSTNFECDRSTDGATGTRNENESAKEPEMEECNVMNASGEVADEFEDVRLCKEAQKRNHKGETQLHLACKKGLVRLVQKLVDTPGTDLNCVDWSNMTPLHEAVQTGSVECVKLLLQAGCLPNVPAQKYITPLHQAVYFDWAEIAKLLIQYGADLDAGDIEGKTPMENCDDAVISDFRSIRKVTGIAKRLVFNCDSSKCGPKRTRPTELDLLAHFNITNGMEHLLVDNHEKANLFSPQVLTALLQGVPVIYVQDEHKFLQCTSLSFVNLIPQVLRDAYVKSLHNRLHRLPKLLDGLNIHLPARIGKYKIDDVIFTRSDLQGLIEIAGGIVLKRAPTESTVDGISTQPFHCRNDSALKCCSHLIVYDDLAAPLLRYKMKELRHVSAYWLTHSMWKFQLVL